MLKYHTSLLLKSKVNARSQHTAANCCSVCVCTCVCKYVCTCGSIRSSRFIVQLDSARFITWSSLMPWHINTHPQCIELNIHNTATVADYWGAFRLNKKRFFARWPPDGRLRLFTSNNNELTAEMLAVSNSVYEPLYSLLMALEMP